MVGVDVTWALGSPQHKESKAMATDNVITKTIVYTGAPQDADYEPTTKTIETFEVVLVPGGRSKIWRKVEITNDQYRTAYQCDRYGSFLGGCPTLDDPRTHPIGTGRLAPTNSHR
jgi:L-lactate utilization protein LutB